MTKSEYKPENPTADEMILWNRKNKDKYTDEEIINNNN